MNDTLFIEEWYIEWVKDEICITNKTEAKYCDIANSNFCVTTSTFLRGKLIYVNVNIRKSDCTQINNLTNIIPFSSKTKK